MSRSKMHTILATAAIVIGVMAVCEIPVLAEKGGKGNPDNLVNPAWVGIDNNSIVLMSSDGLETQVLLGGGKTERFSPTWSPDGQTLAFIKRNRSGIHLCLIDANGDNERVLRSFGSYDAPMLYAGLQWVPGEVNRILMRHYDYRLSTISTVTGEWHTLLIAGTEEWFDGTDPHLTPDLSDDPGYQGAIAYGWINVAGADPDSLVDVGISLVSEGAQTLEVDTSVTAVMVIPDRQEGFAWSPDGLSLAFTDRGLLDPKIALHVVPVAITHSTEDDSIVILDNFLMTLEISDRNTAILENPTWSPDGNWLAYSMTVGGAPGGGHLIDHFIVRTDGSAEPINVTNNGSAITSHRFMQPHWNPLWENDLDP